MEARAFELLLSRLGGDGYESLRARLIRYFRWERCAGPEDLADETFDRAARKLADGEAVENLERYTIGIAKMILRESRTRARREDQAWRRMPAASEAQPDQGVLDCLDACLGTLAKDQRELILNYYGATNHIETRKRMALSLNIEINALRNRALRLRERLEACVRSCIAKRRDGTVDSATKRETR